MLCRLQLGTVRRLKHEPDAIGYNQVFRPMPSGTIELKDDPFVCASTRPDLAKSKRMASNNSLHTAFETFHTVAPVAGSTKPQT